MVQTGKTQVAICYLLNDGMKMEISKLYSLDKCSGVFLTHRYLKVIFEAFY